MGKNKDTNNDKYKSVFVLSKSQVVDILFEYTF